MCFLKDGQYKGDKGWVFRHEALITCMFGEGVLIKVFDV